MKNYLKTIVFIFTIIILGIPMSTFLRRDNNTNIKIEITYEKIEEIIKNEKGNIIGIMYYNKPVLNGNTDSLESINNFFGNEASGFFYGSSGSLNFPDGSHKYFIDRVNRGREGFGDNVMDKSPFANTVDVAIIYQDNKIISFKESTHWNVGGANNDYYYGVTFNIKTGKPLTIDYFTTQNNAEFNQNVILQLSRSLSNYKIILDDKWINEINNYNFSNYNYFYDGKYIYLIFNGLTMVSSSYILKLNN